jgi:hypothetical protein
MRPLLLAALALSLVSGPGLSRCWATEKRDQTSVFLSKYLHDRSLPLVEARFIADPNDNDILVLYGFVATDRGRLNAEDQSLDFLCDPDVEIHNLIKVTPVLLRPSTSFDGITALSVDASFTAIDESAAESASRGSDNPYDSIETITDREAQRPWDPLDGD